MKFKAGEAVKISRNNSLLFDATGSPATVISVQSYFSDLMKKNYYTYEIAIERDGREHILYVEEQELCKR